MEGSRYYLVAETLYEVLSSGPINVKYMMNGKTKKMPLVRWRKLDKKEIITVQQAAAIIGCKIDNVYKHIGNGTLKVSEIETIRVVESKHKQYFLDKQELLQLLKEASHGS
jgi:hypothetical protein